ncbi:MAG: hypothetical protein KF819_24835 [Labilithrix sp.]|nr:hypothetical protein [Labilithrix sp.]
MASLASWACGAFDAEAPPPGVDPIEGGADVVSVPDGAATEAGACQLTPGVGPPQLRPEAGPPEVLCGSESVQLETSPKNCGACGRDCGPGVQCNVGLCVSTQIVDVGTDVFLQARAGDHVFVTNQSRAYELALTGGTVPTALLELEAGCCLGRIVTDDEAIYAMEANEHIWRRPIGPGAPALLDVRRVGAETLALTRNEAVFGNAGLGLVLAVDKRPGGGSARTISTAESGVRFIVADGDVVYWMRVPSWLDAAGLPSEIVRHDTASGDTRRSVALPHAQALAVDESFVYFYQGTTGEIRRMPKNLSGEGEVLGTWNDAPEARTHAHHIALTADHVYVLIGTANAGARVIVRVPKCGGAPIPIFWSKFAPVSGPIIDDENLYFSEGSTLRRVAP